jgi:arylsulfatase A-like enzyme
MMPNFVLINCDDLGYGDLGCYGHPLIRTPNLDRLAASGQRWTRFLAPAGVCVPSRIGLHTGCFPYRFQGERTIKAVLPDGTVSLAELLGSAGYRTACIGKWHMGLRTLDSVKGTDPLDLSFSHPNARGFEYFYGTPSSNDHFGPRGFAHTYEAMKHVHWSLFDVPLVRQDDVIERPADQSLFTRRYTEEAVAWIRAHRSERFFLYLAHNMPHLPLFPSDRFSGRSAAGRYGDVVEELDWSAGEIAAALESEGIADETLFVFTSDNGPWRIYGELGGSPGPFRNGKGTCWDGAFEVPAIFSWPGAITPAVITELGSGLDLYATFASLAGLSPPPGASLDGLDLSPVLLERGRSPRERFPYFHESGGLWGIRSGRFKLHRRTVDAHHAPPVDHDPPLLFDVDADLGESIDIGDEALETRRSLELEMDRFFAELARGSSFGHAEASVKGEEP